MMTRTGTPRVVPYSQTKSSSLEWTIRISSSDSISPLDSSEPVSQATASVARTRLPPENRVQKSENASELEKTTALQGTSTVPPEIAAARLRCCFDSPLSRENLKSLFSSDQVSRDDLIVVAIEPSNPSFSVKKEALGQAIPADLSPLSSERVVVSGCDEKLPVIRFVRS